MKKKQLEKLKKQFRPSFETARKMLFDEMEKQTLAKHGLTIQVSIKPTNQSEMAIELVGETTRDQVISVPLDENFNTVVKRIQNQEKGLLTRFSENLADEVANYWAEPVTVAQPEPVEEAVSENVQEISDGMTFAEFTEKMTAFPKFQVHQTADDVQVVEKTPKEERLLATISMKEKDNFTIEAALERKYKLKLDVIPVIETFAKTEITHR
ncbi:hypothetical protein IV487_01380 [Enterococcus saccharolyticus]|uniref:Uncharacterized protein n=1 Tax=Candidatus Enterococcus willemsii TaxID=1857215 RepID=A0ABQ6YVV2_9ENTE|nr:MULTISPECIES: hypothetical protein [Enterococcus]KAF1301063.1 hypothetical protein BAU17_09585 [Enterococcus sp. CU12B]MCD5001130.1 hypothetical protein [Enterococcus saccharolyticus]